MKAERKRSTAGGEMNKLADSSKKWQTIAVKYQTSATESEFAEKLT